MSEQREFWHEATMQVHIAKYAALIKAGRGWQPYGMV